MAQVIPLNPLFERIPAPLKKFKEVAVFVHHYGGHRLSFKSHMEWLNELGFDVVTFDLPFQRLSEIRKRIPIDKEWNVGIRHVWADKIEQVLGHLSENKFLFSFSSPSIAALAALARRHAVDVKGWICEGGPFADLPAIVNNFIKSGGLSTPDDVFAFAGSSASRPHSLAKFPSRFLHYPLIHYSISQMAAVAFGLRHYERDFMWALQALPKGFPVLSVRGEKDTLVPAHSIDNLFVTALQQIDFQRLTLPVGHVAGFKEGNANYKHVVGGFLLSHATPT